MPEKQQRHSDENHSRQNQAEAKIGASQELQDERMDEHQTVESPAR